MQRQGSCVPPAATSTIRHIPRTVLKNIWMTRSSSPLPWTISSIVLLHNNVSIANVNWIRCNTRDNLQDIASIQVAFDEANKLGIRHSVDINYKRQPRRKAMDMASKCVRRPLFIFILRATQHWTQRRDRDLCVVPFGPLSIPLPAIVVSERIRWLSFANW